LTIVISAIYHKS